MTDQPDITDDNAGIPDVELPTKAVKQAFAEFLQIAVEGQGDLPPGLDVRVEGDVIEVLSRGRVLATINRAVMLERAGEIAGEQN